MKYRPLARFHPTCLANLRGSAAAFPRLITLGTLAPIVLLWIFPLRASADPAADFRKNVQPILAKYCYDCHGDGEKKGQVSLDSFQSDQALLGDHDLWWRVLKNVRAGIMPPRKKDQPSPEEKGMLAEWIKRGPFGLDPKNPDPGRVTIRRLNRVEYRNTIHDLMGIDYNTVEEFPPDDTGYGFDTIGDVLSISPMLLEKYVKAAESIVSTAVPSVGKVAPEIVLTARQFRDEKDPNPAPPPEGAPRRGGRNRDQRMSFYKEATVASSFTLKHAGDYQIDVETAVNGSFDFDPGRCTVSFQIDGKELLNETYKWQNGKAYRYQLKSKLDEGKHQVSFTLHPLVPPEPRQTSIDFRITTVKIVGPMDKTLWTASPQYLRFFPKEEPPQSPEARREYAQQVLRAFTGKAFRRPVDERMLGRLVDLAQSVYSQPGRSFEEGIKQAMVAVVASPRFLFRIEETVATSPDQRFAPIDEYALASRLSYFFWSTMPDQELMDLARRGELRKNLQAQVKRLMDDPRSEALVQNFVGQWLQVRDVEGVSIDARTVLAQDAGQEKELQAQMAQLRAQFARQQALNAAGQANADQANGANGANRSGNGQPNANGAQAGANGAQANAQANANGAQANANGQPPAAGFRRGNNPQRQFNRRFFRPAVQLDGPLRDAMQKEADMFFGYVMHEDRSVLDFLGSDYTFVNDTLAKFYGIPDVTGTDMRRVTLPKDSPRGGLLTMGATLVVTSNPTRTSPVKRGQFILDNILGMPAPPPPANIPPLEDSDKKSGESEPSFRQVLEIHRDKPLCKSCHSRMDPLGLSLENFNAMGMWREKERGQAIDASGQLLSGESFHDIRDLKSVLRENHRLDFYRCLTEKLLTYALGRGLDYYDVETVDQIVGRMDREDGKFSALLMGVVESSAFQERRVGPAAGAQPAKPVEQRVQNGSNHETQKSS